MLAIIISMVALTVAVIALVIATKRQTLKVIKETKVEHAPVDHPFIYNETSKVYVLHGDLKVDGEVSCMHKKKS